MGYHENNHEISGDMLLMPQGRREERPTEISGDMPSAWRRSARGPTEINHEIYQNWLYGLDACVDHGVTPMITDHDTCEVAARELGWHPLKTINDPTKPPGCWVEKAKEIPHVVFNESFGFLHSSTKSYICQNRPPPN